MAARHLVAAAFVCALAGCARKPPSFPTHAPPQIAGSSTADRAAEPSRPPARGVANFAISPEARSRITLIVSGASALFLLVLIIALFSARDAVVPAGLAAALAGPVVALVTSVRHIPQMLMVTREPGVALASLSLDLWNLSQPLLYALYASAACLAALVIAAVFTRSSAPRSTSTTVLPVIIVIMASVAFALYANVSRMIIAIVDPNAPFQGGSIAEISQSIATRIVAAYVISLGLTLLIAIGVAIAFALRVPMRGAIVMALVALVLVASAAFVEHASCARLEHAARTGVL